MISVEEYINSVSGVLSMMIGIILMIIVCIIFIHFKTRNNN
jgi:hypothetical protein